MRKYYELTCIEDYKNEKDERIFTKGRVYSGMRRSLVDTLDGKLSFAIRVKDDLNERIHFYEKEQKELLDEYFTVVERS